MDGLRQMQVLLKEISALLQEQSKTGRNAAIKKLNDVATISSTLSLTLRVAR
jgi:hypothetical protein